MASRNIHSFELLLHDTESQASFVINSPILLHPGSVYDIAMQPVKTTLKPERLGRCTSKVESFLNPNNIVPMYNRQECLANCIVEYMWKNCKCGVPLVNQTVLAKHFGVKVESVEPCSSSTRGIDC